MSRRLRVLYIHFFGPFGGASRSLFEAVSSFPAGAVEAKFLTQAGSVTAFFSKAGEVIETAGLTQIDHTRYSYYRGLRWIVVLRELAFLPSTLLALRRAKQTWNEVDIIHLNEASGLIVARLVRFWFKAPIVLHVRSVLRNAPRSLRTRWVHRMLRSRIQGIVAIDENVRASLPHDLHVEVIHNGFTPAFKLQVDEALDCKLRKLRPASFKVGFVGNLLRVKGILELIEAARITRDRGLDIEFLIVGDDARPSRGLRATAVKLLGLQQNVRAEIEVKLDDYSLRDRVHLLGFTTDLSRVYGAVDVLAFPSHYDAPGRPIFEAAFFAVPSIVAVRDPKPDTLVDKVTGLSIEPRSADQLAQAISTLADDRDYTKKMGLAAQHMAQQNFNAGRNAAKLLALYQRLISSP